MWPKLCNEVVISFGYGRRMGNYGDSRTEFVRIHEIGVEPASAAPDSPEERVHSTQNDRGHNSYFIGAWILVALSTGLGALWLLGLVREQPERYGNVVTVDAATGLPSFDGSNTDSTVLENLAELAPNLFLIGLSGALALLIVQGVTHRRRRQSQQDER
ncbi:hypothetical protein JOD47_002101 [Arthrobacter tumbae]|nr:hypothetical protein [Arthrobacter tumbae]